MADDLELAYQELLRLREEIRAGFASCLEGMHADRAAIAVPRKAKAAANPREDIVDGYNRLIDHYEQITESMKALREELSKLRAVIVKQFGE
jgi:Mg2+ and Co2+ transporter CorA